MLGSGGGVEANANANALGISPDASLLEETKVQQTGGNKTGSSVMYKPKKGNNSRKRVAFVVSFRLKKIV